MDVSLFSERKGATVIEDHTLVECGGSSPNEWACYVLDLRKPTWEWRDDVIPQIPRRQNSFIMEYVKATKKIYILGGKKSNNIYTHVILLQSY